MDNHPPRNQKNPRWFIPLLVFLGLALAFSSGPRHNNSKNIKSHDVPEKKITEDYGDYTRALRNEDNMAIGDDYKTDDLTINISSKSSDSKKTLIKTTIINRSYERVGLDDNRFKAFDAYGQEVPLGLSDLKQKLDGADGIMGKEEVSFNLTADSKAVAFLRFMPTVSPDTRGKEYGQWILMTDQEFDSWRQKLKDAAVKARAEANEVAKKKLGIDDLVFPNELLQRTAKGDLFEETGNLQASSKGQDKDKKDQLFYQMEFKLDGSLVSLDIDHKKLL